MLEDTLKAIKYIH